MILYCYYIFKSKPFKQNLKITDDRLSNNLDEELNHLIRHLELN